MHLLFKFFAGPDFWLKPYRRYVSPGSCPDVCSRNEQEECEAMAERDFDFPRSTNRLTAKQQGLLFLNMVAHDRVCAVCAYTFYDGFLDPSGRYFKTSNHADLQSASQQPQRCRRSPLQVTADAISCRYLSLLSRESAIY